MSRMKRGRAASSSSSANSAVVIRLQKDLEEVTTLTGCKLFIPDQNNIQHFIARITPEVGIWAEGNFDFNFVVPEDYPTAAPTITILTRIWHPNIAEDGRVCLNILKEKYKPVYSIAQLVAGLQFLFTEPNPQSPLNNDASLQFQQDRDAFTKTAIEYIQKYCPK